MQAAHQLLLFIELDAFCRGALTLNEVQFLFRPDFLLFSLLTPPLNLSNLTLHRGNRGL